MIVSTQRMITSQPAELASGINGYYVTWSRLWSGRSLWSRRRNSAASTRPSYSGEFTTDNYSKTECQCRKLTRSAAPPDLRLHTYCGDLRYRSVFCQNQQFAVVILVSGHHRHHHHRPPSGMAAAAQQRRWSRAVRAHQARAREADSSKCQAAKVGAKSRWFARYSTIAIERPLNLRLVPACPVKSPGAPGSIARAFVQSAQKPIRPDS